MKVMFLGSTRRGFEVLESLSRAGVELVGVASLRQFASETENFEEKIATFADRNRLPLLEIKSASDDRLPEFVRSSNADLVVAVGVRSIVDAKALTIPKNGFWAVHDSLLPAYRGFAPTNWAIINGENRAGVTLFQMSEESDRGRVLLQRAFDIAEDEFAHSVVEKVIRATIEVVGEGVRMLQDGKLEPRQQDEALATYTCSRNPEDGLIDWSRSSREVFNLIRGLASPFPGAFTYFAEQRLVVSRAKIVEPAPRYVGAIPGRVVSLNADGSIDVMAGDGIVRVEEFVLASGDKVKPTAMVKSVRVKLGFDTAQLWERICRLEARLADLGQ